MAENQTNQNNNENNESLPPKGTAFSVKEILAACALLNPTHGRQPILTNVDEITDDNVIRVLNKAIGVFEQNKRDAQWLYDYYRGIQPILYREKEIRPEICNVVVENRAYEIVTFKTGRFLYKSIQYTNRSEKTLAEVDELNRMMYADGKAGKDRELVDWFHIAGDSFRLVVTSDDEGAPFHIYSVSPSEGFVVRRATVDRKPMMGVIETVIENDDQTNTTVYTVYTDKFVYKIRKGADTWDSKTTHILGDVPLVEYPLNMARLGCFEVVISLLNAINNAQSNRLDGIEQFIQALLVFKGFKVNGKQVTQLREEGAICLPEGVDLDYLTRELNQSQVQTLVDDLYQAVLTICGMPNRNGGSSTSDNKGAVVLRDGWSAAATAVKETKQYFEQAERRMLSMVLKAFNIYRDMVKPEREPLTLSDIDIHFDEGEYENMLEKVQALTMMLGNGWVHPKFAYEVANLTSDPEAAYIAGKKFHDEQAKAETEELDAVGRTRVNSYWRNNL